jgi:hypothetical protein
MSRDDARSAGRDKRRERLAASLRENLKRRKIQQRLRKAEERPAGDGKAPPPSPDSKV